MTSTLRAFVAAFLILSASGAVSFLATGCSTAEIDENDPAVLMKEAEEDIGSSRYIVALEKLQRVKNQHPYSSQAIDAQLRIADVYFLQENFAEAAATYEAFKDLHPKHPKLPYSAYRVGLSFYSDMPGNHARDLSAGYKAEEAFKEYLQRFPSAEYTADVQTKLAETRKILAGKELYVADFYYKRGMWEAAKGRYSKILNQYSDSPYVADAQAKLKKIEEKPAEKTD
ncbi:MAG: outer membrane protein assembly factor BamD [Cryobacterium sp.]|nr:outer membrane protein assembly factor BamD [Oligoflexia bacterium]